MVKEQTLLIPLHRDGGFETREREQQGYHGKKTEALSSCSFSWEKLKEMKDNKIEFWAADGLNKLRIFEIDELEKSAIWLINWEKEHGHLSFTSWKSCTKNFTMEK